MLSAQHLEQCFKIPHGATFPNTARLNNIVLKSNFVTLQNGTSGAPSPTFWCYGLLCRKIAALGAGGTTLVSYAHSSFLTPHSSFERRFPLHIVSHGTLPPFLPLYFAVLCNFTIIFGCFNVKNHLSRSISLQTLFSLSKQ